MMRSVVLLVAVAVAMLAVAAVSAETVTHNAGLVNTRVYRSINLQTHVEENYLQFDIQNSGSSETDYYLLPVASEKVSHLSYVSARRVSDKKADADQDLDPEDVKDRATKGGVVLKATQVEVTGSDVSVCLHTF
jgi:hypothetical protein